MVFVCASIDSKENTGISNMKCLGQVLVDHHPPEQPLCFLVLTLQLESNACSGVNVIFPKVG